LATTLVGLTPDRDHPLGELRDVRRIKGPIFDSTIQPPRSYRLILPDGQISRHPQNPVHPLPQKYSACAVGQITATSLRRPAPERGAYAQSPRTLGAGCDGRVGVARRAMRMRTAKSCGPDAPTLASSRRKQFRRRRWQKSPVAGESTK
jgi:hypothetical protein